ncbi:hypothetical protein [Georgenia thermotolerans]|uniref:Uncharacterized protein n=1 Tax=Georgenia thermotolerans TaxID=527326 RepID=A0A7J5UJN8_9MICO|nr:hypothetical protein [Georgenia thermotolerans]KAE8762491.1 hypothetical protein GB883_19085 [Georgenia thermotolerans]
MSPKSRGRKRKPDRSGPTRRAPRRRDDEGKLVTLLGGQVLEAGADPLEAELALAANLGELLAAPWGEEDADAPWGGLVETCARLATPEALAVALVLAELLPQPELRDRAARVAAELEATLPPPPWSETLGTARLVRCLQAADVFGDQASLLLEFDRVAPVGRHGLMVQLDFNGPGVWTESAFLVEDVTEARARLHEHAAASNGITEVEEVSPGRAHDLAAAGLARALAMQREDVAWRGPDEDFWSTWPIVAARLRTFGGDGDADAPAVPAAEIGALVEEFLGAPEARRLAADREAVRDWAEEFARAGNQCGGRPLRVGPGLTELLVRRHAAELDPEQLDAFGLALMGWNDWAARRLGLPTYAVDVLLEATDRLLSVAPGLASEDGPWPEEDWGDELGDEPEDLWDATHIPGTVPPDTEAERRRFAMPCREATIDGERFTDLDPADQDDLMLLIVGEQPRAYQRVLNDPVSDELVDGVNPRLRVALLQVVITRLWNDEPPETWHEARRMMADGMRRREILEALAAPVAEEIWRAMQRREAED